MTPWDDLPPYESDRIAGLPFEEMIFALLDHAPKASAADIVSVLGNTHTKTEIRTIRDKWKAQRKGTPADEPFVPQIPTREAVIQNLGLAVGSRDAKETERWARALLALGRAGDVDPAPETTEDWDRLSDLEAGVMIALARKLNGEPLTQDDGRWLARLR